MSGPWLIFVPRWNGQASNSLLRTGAGPASALENGASDELAAGLTATERFYAVARIGAGEPLGDLFGKLALRLGHACDPTRARSRSAFSKSCRSQPPITSPLTPNLLSPDTPGGKVGSVPIRILHIISDLRMGGAESMLARLVGALDASRFDNRVLSLRSVGPIGEQIRRSGIPVRALGLQTRPTALWNGLAEVRRFHPDIIQTWLYHADLFGLLGRLAAPSSRLLWNVRCSNMDSERYRWLTRLAAVLSAVPNGIVVNSEVGRGVHERL